MISPLNQVDSLFFATSGYLKSDCHEAQNQIAFTFKNAHMAPHVEHEYRSSVKGLIRLPQMLQRYSAHSQACVISIRSGSVWYGRKVRMQTYDLTSMGSARA